MTDRNESTTHPTNARRVKARRVTTSPRAEAQLMFRDMLSVLTEKQLELLDVEISAFMKGNGLGAGLAEILRAGRVAA